MNADQIPPQTLHCHTLYSDGGDQPREMVRAAALKGFRRIGISDHLVLHPRLGRVDWSMNPDWLDDYIAAVHAAGDRAGLEVLVGLEVDFFPDAGWRRGLDALLRTRPIDYLVGSVHYLDDFNLDGSADPWEAFDQEEIRRIHEGYWRRVAAMAAMGGWTFLGHLDLPKKFGFVPEAEPVEAIEEAVAAIARSGIPIELNTGGWDKPCDECYPGPDLLARCRAAGIAVVVNDDAHTTAHLGRHYGRAPAVLAAAGYEGVAELAPRRVRLL